MPDKTSKDRQEKVKFVTILVCLAAAHAQIITSLQTKVHVVPVTINMLCIYTTVVGTGQQALLFKFIRRAPNPLHSHTALLLEHIR